MSRPTDVQPDPRETDWRRAIEQAARQDALTRELPALGEHIAWAVLTMTGLTMTDLSPLHRVGPHLGLAPHAMCGERIPPSLRWFPLSAALVRTMPRCGYCEAGVARAHPEAA